MKQYFQESPHLGWQNVRRWRKEASGSMRALCVILVHKDSVYVCIINLTAKN